MTTVETSLRVTRDSAKLTRFEPVGTIEATNVQDAISELATDQQPITPTSVTTTPYAVTTETLLWVDTSAGAMEIVLPAGVARGGRKLEIKDITGDANANNITVTPAGAETIDGLAPWVININYGSLVIDPKPAGGWTQSS